MLIEDKQNVLFNPLDVFFFTSFNVTIKMITMMTSITKMTKRHNDVQHHDDDQRHNDDYRHDHDHRHDDDHHDQVLENKRLDLDACKNKVRKARSLQMQPPVRFLNIFNF